MNEHIAETLRLLHNLLNVGVIAEVQGATCRVQIGDLLTDWLPWLTLRAGSARIWWPPSPGEQVVVLALGGELTTACCLGGIYSAAHPAPCDLPRALHVSFPDGAVLQYNPDDGGFLLQGAKTAHVSVSGKTTWDCPETEFTGVVKAVSLQISQGGEMKGNITHTGGQFSSNGVVVDAHTHGGVQTGGGDTREPNR